MTRCVGKRIACRRRSGVTLIELLAVSAIIASLMTVTIPAVKGLLQTSQLAQAENLMRATLYSARTYAVQEAAVAGVRFQDDGHMVQIYARNDDRTYSPKDFTKVPVYSMRAVEGVEPARLPDPWRVTVRDVGNCDTASGLSGDMLATWTGKTERGYVAAKEWLEGEHPWFVFPVTVFSPQGRVILPDLVFHYSTDPSSGWYPTMEGSFGALTDGQSNPYPNPPTQLHYTNQVAAVGWRSGGNIAGGADPYLSYSAGSTADSSKGGDGSPRYSGQCGGNRCCKGSKSASASYNVPVQTPTVSAQLRLFNYTEFRGTPNKELALLGILSSSSDCILDVNTGLPVRARAHQQTMANMNRGPGN